MTTPLVQIKPDRAAIDKFMATDATAELVADTARMIRVRAQAMAGTVAGESVTVEQYDENPGRMSKAGRARSGLLAKHPLRVGRKAGADALDAASKTQPGVTYYRDEN